MKVIVAIVLFFITINVTAQQKFEVFFDFANDTPNDTSITNLNQWIASHRSANVEKLTGFTDSIDNNSFNRDLSDRRIQNVLEILKQQNVALSPNLSLQPMGEDSKGTNPERNRRVEIYFTNQSGPAREEAFVYVETPPLIEKVSSAKKGDVIVLKNINFYLNSEKVVPESEPALNELYEVMLSRPKLKVEIHGHICCNRNTANTALSYRRAKYIFTYLLEKGIALNRLGYKGFGSARPIYKIPEASAEEKAANRRVELLIMSI